MPGSTNPRQKVLTSVCQRANHPARQTTTTIFASSDGWNRPTTGALIQRFDPNSGAMMPGTKQSANKTQAPMNIHGANLRNLSIGQRAANTAATKPSVTIIAWRLRKW